MIVGAGEASLKFICKDMLSVGAGLDTFCQELQLKCTGRNFSSSMEKFSSVLKLLN